MENLSLKGFYVLKMFEPVFVRAKIHLHNFGLDLWTPITSFFSIVHYSFSLFVLCQEVEFFTVWFRPCYNMEKTSLGIPKKVCSMVYPRQFKILVDGLAQTV